MELESMLQNKAAIASVTKAPEAQELMQMLQHSSNQEELKGMAQSALKGDTSQLKGLMQQLMENPKSAKLIEQLNRNFQKK